MKLKKWHCCLGRALRGLRARLRGVAGGHTSHWAGTALSEVKEELPHLQVKSRGGGLSHLQVGCCCSKEELFQPQAQHFRREAASLPLHLCPCASETSQLRGRELNPGLLRDRQEY